MVIMFIFLYIATSRLLFDVYCLASEAPDNVHHSDKIEFLVTNRNEIWRIDQHDNFQYFTNATAICDVDYHLEKNLLVWIDCQRNEIHFQSLNENVTDFFISFQQKTYWKPVALAIDYIGDKIYIADSLGSKIDVLDIDGRHQSIVIGTNLIQPTDITLDSLKRLMFILDRFRIIRMNLDGSLPVIIIKGNIKILHGISIDPVYERIYWTRINDSKILSSNYSGENIITSPINLTNYTWTKFATFETSIFLATNFINYKSKCFEEKIEDRFNSVYPNNPLPVIKIVHSSQRSLVSNPCNVNNGGCQQTCMFLQNNNNHNVTHRCACYTGWVLNSNSKNCSRIMDFLIYSQSTILKFHQVENCQAEFCEPYLPISDKNNRIYDFDYNHRDNYIYYIVKRRINYDFIKRVQPNTNNGEIFSVGRYASYQSLAIDRVTSNLYFIDSLNGSISVINTTNASSNLILLYGLETPKNIAIHPYKRLLFFLQNNRTTDTMYFSRAQIDGSNLMLFRNITLKGVCGFSIDFNNDRIYWFDWGNHSTIQHSTLNFDDVKYIRTSLTKYFYSIFVYKKWIYFVSMRSEGLWRIDKETGEHPELIFSDFANRITQIKAFSYKIQNINEVRVMCNEFISYKEIHDLSTKMCNTSTSS